MSFGTGHHETTSMVLESQLQYEHRDKSVLDVGTGTGILSILAYQKGARRIDATDIDEWSIKNCHENFELNKVKNYRIHQGEIKNLTLEPSYDMVLANINKNIIISEIEHYAKLLKNGGRMLLSGFLVEDTEIIKEYSAKYDLILCASLKKNKWACLTFTK
jgi:ribosomal protein L11 methyltransferase